MAILSNLEPKRVFEIFEEMCAIPHGSTNTKAISDWCVAFGEKLGLEHYQDEANNVILIAPATPGYEDAPAVIRECEEELAKRSGGELENGAEERAPAGPVLTAEDVRELESMCEGVSGYFYKMLNFLEERLQDGVRRGRFTWERVRRSEEHTSELQSGPERGLVLSVRLRPDLLRTAGGGPEVRGEGSRTGPGVCVGLAHVRQAAQPLWGPGGGPGGGPGACPGAGRL